MRDLGADNRQPCHNGYYPIHEASKNAASRTMEVLLQWAESRGNSRHQMISFFDAEGNVPLHSAVHSGDFKVNKIQKGWLEIEWNDMTSSWRVEITFHRRGFLYFYCCVVYGTVTAIGSPPDNENEKFSRAGRIRAWKKQTYLVQITKSSYPPVKVVYLKTLLLT